MVDQGIGPRPGELKPTLMDAMAVMVGYGLASLLVRAYLSDNRSPAPLELMALSMVFVWLGLAMSGPVVLLVRRPVPEAADGDDQRPESRTWAELAWMIIGFYWIGLTVLVVPARSNGARFLDSAVLGLFPILAALALRVLGPRNAWARARPRKDERSWTHRTGLALLLTWPFVWVGMFLLGRSLL